MLISTKKPKKMNRSKYTYIISIAILAIAGYFYFTRNNIQPQTIEKHNSDVSESIDPKDILKYDPNAPAWMQEAESCTLVAGKIFCKLKGE